MLCLVAVVTFGASWKITANSAIEPFHELAGFLSGITGAFVLFKAFSTKQSQKVKKLVVTTFLLTIFAGLGGKLLSTGINYNLFYLQMVLSGFTALILTSYLFIKFNKLK